MIPKTAYETAKKGGYELKEEPCRHKLMHDENGCPFGFHYPEWQVTALDPAFFQALGKALGWNKIGHEVPNLVGDWQWHAKHFYDLILTGGNTVKFWSELLGTNPEEYEGV
jgi:hypothetical protein